MAYFEKDFISFFKELNKNNSKEWFDENRKRYKNIIKEPFAAFVGEMIKRIQAHDANLLIEPKDCILRINRDIRFAKDKTPYNTYVTAFISKGGRKDKSQPGFFLRLSAEMCGIMCGCYMPDKIQLQKIRTAIVTKQKEFEKIISDKNFIDKFGELKGEENKRLPKEWKEAIENQPLVAKKQFYIITELPAKTIVSDSLADILMEYYYTARPFNLFLEKAIS